MKKHNSTEIFFKLFKKSYTYVSDKELWQHLKNMHKEKLFKFLKKINPKNCYRYRDEGLYIMFYTRTHKYVLSELSKKQFNRLVFLKDTKWIAFGLIKQKLNKLFYKSSTNFVEDQIYDFDELLAPLIVRLNRKDYLKTIHNKVNFEFQRNFSIFFCDYNFIFFLEKTLVLFPTSYTAFKILKSKYKPAKKYLFQFNIHQLDEIIKFLEKHILMLP